MGSDLYERSRGVVSGSRREILRKLSAYVHRPGWLVERAVRVRSIKTRDIAWIFGVGRSGSTWLSELLDGLHSTRVWHEPYFGTLFSRPDRDPSEFDRRDSFFARDYEQVWAEGLRNVLLTNARARFGRISTGTKIIIKDINAPQICPFFASVFPDSKFLFLVRDPYDVLDSHIDSCRKGSWNEHVLTDTRTLAEHVRRSLERTLDGYRHVGEGGRLIVRYQNLLGDPEAELATIAQFLGLPATRSEIEKTVDAHRFKNHDQTGRLAFRRFGKAGIWKESGNFTPEVIEVAQNVLGELRASLGYEAVNEIRREYAF